MSMATYHTVIGRVVGYTKHDANDVYIEEGCEIVLYRTYDDVDNLFFHGIRAIQNLDIVLAIKSEAHIFRHLRLPGSIINPTEILLKLYDTPQYHPRHGHYVAWQPKVPIITWIDTVKSFGGSFSGSFSTHTIINPNPSP
jgi:hypothetical protein